MKVGALQCCAVQCSAVQCSKRIEKRGYDMMRIEQLFRSNTSPERHIMRGERCAVLPQTVRDSDLCSSFDSQSKLSLYNIHLSPLP